MKRTFTSFVITDIVAAKDKLLSWCKSFEVCMLLSNHQYPSAFHRYECIVAAGVYQQFQANSGNALSSLQNFIDVQDDWIFGHLNYDLKNEIENLSSRSKSNIFFPDVHFFVPRYVIKLNENKMEIGSFVNDHEEVFASILKSNGITDLHKDSITITSRISKEDYIKTVKQLQQHILKGDCYEINFCQEFFAEHTSIQPERIFSEMCKISPNPFSAFYKLNHQFLCCASPERYLLKQNEKIISQPIKGTEKRMMNSAEDEQLKQQLYLSKKDRSENVMVVDLVRNDLTKVCKEGSVVVSELYGIYSFPQVHQMISTIEGELKNNVLFTEIIKATFPMGSMTGAPKHKVMQLIDLYENFQRGLFSGSVGYIDPDKNFDFNVVIRSIFFNQLNGYLSFVTGSGITFYSDAEKEYDECLLKAAAIMKVFS